MSATGQTILLVVVDEHDQAESRRWWTLIQPRWLCRQGFGRAFRVAPIFSTDANQDSRSWSIAPMTVLMLASCAAMLLLMSGSKCATLFLRR